MKKLWMFLVLVVALGLTAGSAVAKTVPGGLDQSFGNGGVVEVKPPLPAGWKSQFVRALAASPDGSSYALLQRSDCEGPTCPSGRYALARYAPDGSLDTAFGGSAGAFELPVSAFTVPRMVVDSEGRLVIALPGSGQIVLHRVTATGQVDTSFGNGGSTVIQCGVCGLPIPPVAGPDGTLNIVSSALVGENGKPFGGTVATIVRLDGNGAPLATFGESGRMSIGLSGGPSVTGATLAKQGGLYLTASGSTFGIRPSHRYVLRVSAKGRLDGRSAAPPNARSNGSIRPWRPPTFKSKRSSPVPTARSTCSAVRAA